jgi:hypothetical protein
MSVKTATRLNRVWCAGLLLAACLPVYSVRADWDFSVFTAEDPGPAGMDRAFEYEAWRLMDEHSDRLQGVDAVVTRFGNTIVITGQAQDEGGRAQVDKLVLEVAGIKREQGNGSIVIPVRTRECGGKAMASNTRRKSIVKPDKDCSSLRSDDGLQLQVKGQLFNHIAIASSDPARQLAGAALQAAQAGMSLLDAGVVNATDRSVIRLVAQDGVMYVLGNPDAFSQEKVRATLMTIDGISDVRFYFDRPD